MFVPFLIAVAVAATPAPAPALQSLSDVTTLVAEGVPAAELVTRIGASDLYLRLRPQDIAELHFDGVPRVVIEALVATGDSPFPKLGAGDDRQIELNYESYRILARNGDGGPRLIVSGFAGDGSRLVPPVEQAPPMVLPRSPASLEPPPAPPRVAIADELPRSPSPPPTASAPRPAVVEYVPDQPPPVAAAVLGYDAYGRPIYGAPYAVTVSEIPAAYRDVGVIVSPYDAPAFGFGHYGYGNPYYGAYAPQARCGPGIGLNYSARGYVATSPLRPPQHTGESGIHQRHRARSRPSPPVGRNNRVSEHARGQRRVVRQRLAD